MQGGIQRGTRSRLDPFAETSRTLIFFFYSLHCNLELSKDEVKWGHSKTTADAELNCGIENVLEINQRWNHFNGKEEV